MKDIWHKAQEWELDWHGNCINSLNEENKQIVYAEKMGLVRTPTPKTPFNFDLEGKSVLDIGGGAYSLLLKCVNFPRAKVADPLVDKYPQWVLERYMEHNVGAFGIAAEELEVDRIQPFDEVWIYNVLQHTLDPKKVLENALELGNIVRIFEWVETGTNIGHLHDLTEKDLNSWLGGEGKVEKVNSNGAVGKAYYGVFKGRKYETTSSN